MAETTVASGKAVIRPELQNGFANKIKGDLNKESGGITKAFGSMGAKIGTAFAAGFAAVGTAAVGFGIAGVAAASNLEESLSKVGVVFGEGATAIEEWSKSSATALGMSQAQALEAAGTYGNLFTAMGIGQSVAQDMSTELVGLAADLASFNNASPEETLNALRAGLSGETEPLKRFGVNLNQATIEAKALSMGLMEQGGELTAAAKAQATYALVMEQTTNAQGDFARTSGGAANQMRILKAELENTAASVGSALLPLVSAGAGAIQGLVANIAEPLGRIAAVVGESLTPLINTVGPILSTLITNIAGTFEKILPPIVDALNRIFVALGPVIDQALTAFGDILIALIPLLDPFVKLIELLAQVATDLLVPILNVVITVFSELVQALAPVITSVIEGLKPAFDAIAQAFQQIDWTPLIEAFKDIASAVGPIITLVAQFAGQLIEALAPILPVLVDALLSMLTALTPVLTLVADLIKSVVEPLMPVITEMVGLMAGNLSQILPQIAGLFVQLVEAAMPLLEAFAELAKELMPIVVDVLNALLPVLIDIQKRGLQILVDTIGFLIEYALKPLIEILTNVYTWIADNIGPIVEWLGAKFSESWQIVSGAVSEAWGIVSGIFESIKEGITAVGTWIGEKIETVVSFFTGLPGRIRDAAAGIWDFLLDSFKNILNSIIDLWNNLKIPSFTIGGWDTPLGSLPSFDTPEIDFPDIPRFAAGGVITEPTVGLMGETAKARPEIVTPEALMRDVFSDVLAAAGGGQGQIVNNFQTQRYSAAELADEVAFRQARQLTGRQR